nr:hypothetical protein [Tanacetum cinerariifolium]
EEGKGDDNDEDGVGEEGDDDDVKRLKRMMTRMMLRKVGMMKRKVEVMIRNLMKKQGKRKALTPQTPESSEDEGNGAEDIGLNVEREEGLNEEEEEDELYRDQESSLVSSQFVTSMLNPTLDVGMESIFETTSRMDVQTPTSIAPLHITTPIMTSSTIATTTTTSQAQILPTTVPSDIIQNLPSFGSLFRFDDRIRSLEENFSEVLQTNQFVGAVSAIPKIVQQYMDQRMNEAVKAKEQVKVLVSKILPRIEQAVNKQLEAEFLTRSSYSSRTSYAVVANLSEMELKKILIEKIEGNKSIQHSDEQRNLYKALVEAYESDKIIIDTYEEMVTLKRRRDDDEDKDEKPFAGPDRGSKRRREGKEPESASSSEYALAEEPVQTTSQMEEPLHPEFDTDLAGCPWKHSTVDKQTGKQADIHSSFNKLMETPLDFSNILVNRLRVDTLTPELLAGPTYELTKGSCKSLIELEYHLEEPLPLIPDNRGRRVIPFEHIINNNLEYLRGGTSSRKYTTSITKTKAADYRHIKWIEDLVPRTMWINEPIGYVKHALWGVSHWGRKSQPFYSFTVNRESARDVYSKRRIIDVNEPKIIEWQSYKHLDWITVRRDDDKLYKFKDGDFKRLHIQDIR